MSASGAAPVTPRPIAIYYEHPDWFRPLFTELDARGINYVKLKASCHSYDPAAGGVDFSLFFNHMSASAYLRGNGRGIFFTHNYLAHLEASGVRVINGSRAFAVETSKALQLQLLNSLGLPFPKTRVVNCTDEMLAAALQLGFPLLVKPNIGGRGAGIVRFAPKAGLKVEGYTPPQEIIDAVEKIVGAAQIEVGSIEYIVDDRDGGIVYYDINALSNFVANAPQILGFDPYVRLVDYLEEQKEGA
jgi:hypothetical protein